MSIPLLPDPDPKLRVEVEVPHVTRMGEVRSSHPGYYPPVSAAAPPARVAADRAVYVRQQRGHSWLLHWLVLGIFSLFVVPIYYSVSPNHFWHL